MKYGIKTMTVYDCQDMPENVQEAFWSFFRRAEYDSVGNDCYVDWWVEAEVDPPPERQLIDDWLIEHGALSHEKQKEEDDGHVIIHHWW